MTLTEAVAAIAERAAKRQPKLEDMLEAIVRQRVRVCRFAGDEITWMAECLAFIRAMEWAIRFCRGLLPKEVRDELDAVPRLPMRDRLITKPEPLAVHRLEEVRP